MIIAGATLNQTPLDWEGNKVNILNAIQEAKQQQVELLCFPELSIPAYGCEDLFYAKWFVEKCTHLLMELMAYTEDISVAVGLPILKNGHLYNCMAMLHDGAILGFSAKQNLANDGVHYEARWFTPWKAFEQTSIELSGNHFPFGDVIYTIKGKNVAFEICEDAWLGDGRVGYVHLQKEENIDILLNPNASHFAFAKHNYRKNEIAIKGSKLFNCVFVMTNLLGNEAGKMIYDGDTYIAQMGKLIASNKRLSFDNFNLTKAVINFDETTLSQGIIADDWEGKEENFTQVISLALFDYCRKSRSKGFILSLSGGADSTCCAILVSEMVKRGIAELGRKKFLEKIGRNDLGEDLSQKEIVGSILTTAYQATENSSEATFNAAKAIAEEIGATFYHWNIDSIVDQSKQLIEANLARPLTWEQDDISLQNIQARSRSPIIWMLANIKQSLLLVTSNRSEASVGYTTMDGDSSGSIAPIGGVDKDFIRKYLLWAEKALDYKSLAHVNSLAPSAELRPLANRQTDEDDLMPYEILNFIEQHTFKSLKSPKDVRDELKATFNLEERQSTHYVKRFYSLWGRNQWKRERTAPSFHVDQMSVDPRSWLRFPILSSSFHDELENL